jgi:hypothetical protein
LPVSNYLLGTTSCPHLRPRAGNGACIRAHRVSCPRGCRYFAHVAIFSPDGGQGGVAAWRGDHLPSDSERGGRVFLISAVELLPLPFLVVYLVVGAGESWRGAGRQRFLPLRPVQRRIGPPVLRCHAGGGWGHPHLPLLVHRPSLSLIRQSAREET